MYTEFSVNRRKGVYLRVICGIRKAQLQGKRVVMLNLTTNSANTQGLTVHEKMESIGKAWNQLHRILSNEFHQFEHYYLVTNEGNGVVHVVIVGLPFLYWKRLMRWWNYLYGSFCWISKVRGSAEGMARYLFSQYLSNQDATVAYGRMSDNWICKKFMSYWRMLRNCSRDYVHGVCYGQPGYPVYCHDYWYYPVDRDMLIVNFKSWLKYFVCTGNLLDYVPSASDFNRKLVVD